MELEEIVLTWWIQLMADLLWNDLGFDVETLIFQMGSLVWMSDGKDMPSQGELECIFIFLRLIMESHGNWSPSYFRQQCLVQNWNFLEFNSIFIERCILPGRVEWALFSSWSVKGFFWNNKSYLCSVSFHGGSDTMLSFLKCLDDILKQFTIVGSLKEQ